MNYYPDLSAASQGLLKSVYVFLASILETPRLLVVYRSIYPEPQLSLIGPALGR
jgi:hypothetical protein